MKANIHKKHDKFPGFPPEPVTNYWPYPKALNGWWHMLNGSEQKCLDYILRHTWGFKKTADYISLSQFQHGVKNLDAGVGLSLPAIIKALRGLEEKSFIKTVKNSGRTTLFELLKNLNGTTKESLGVSTNNSLDTIKDMPIKDNNNISVKPDDNKNYKEEINQAILYLSNKLGVKFPNYGKQARYAKSMFIVGITLEDIYWAIDKLFENSWWHENSFDMKNVADEIPKLMSRTFKNEK